MRKDSEAKDLSTLSLKRSVCNYSL